MKAGASSSKDGPTGEVENLINEWLLREGSEMTLASVDAGAFQVDLKLGEEGKISLICTTEWSVAVTLTLLLSKFAGHNVRHSKAVWPSNECQSLH
jgi:hypothetical protein